MISNFRLYSIFFAFAVFFVIPVYASAGVSSELHITPDGKFMAKNLKVAMITEPGKSTFFYARAYWDDVILRITVLTSNTTVITKQHGEKATVFDIKEGDMINIEGVLPNSSDTMSIQATKIVDTSLVRESKEVKGIVTELSTSNSGFTVKTSKGNLVKVVLTGNTTIIKGVRTISPSDIKIGDNILSAKGVFDYSSYTLEADAVSVYQDNKIFQPKNFEGILNSVSGTVLPTTLSVSVSGKNYTVYLPADALVLNKSKNKISLSRFVVGDTVRFYGSIRPTDLSAIDADTVRDINF